MTGWHLSCPRSLPCKASGHLFACYFAPICLLAFGRPWCTPGQLPHCGAFLSQRAGPGEPGPSPHLSCASPAGPLAQLYPSSPRPALTAAPNLFGSAGSSIRINRSTPEQRAEPSGPGQALLDKRAARGDRPEGPVPQDSPGSLGWGWPPAPDGAVGTSLLPSFLPN